MRPRRSITTILLLGAMASASVALGQSTDATPEACSETGFTPQLMTPSAGHLPRDGAFVVGLFPGDSGPSDALPPLTLTRGRRSIALKSEPIAPGLFRVGHEERRIGGGYTLNGVSGSPQLLFRRSTIPAPPAAPRLERIERYFVANAAGRRLEVRGHFAFPLPDDVVAVVTYWGDDAEPDAFVRSSPTQRSLVLFSSTGRCDAHPEGTTPPPEAGGAVRVAFVDRHGQLSPPSEPRPLQ